jgi:hypothetical protein
MCLTVNPPLLTCEACRDPGTRSLAASLTPRIMSIWNFDRQLTPETPSARRFPTGLHWVRDSYLAFHNLPNCRLAELKFALADLYFPRPGTNGLRRVSVRRVAVAR